MIKIYADAASNLFPSFLKEYGYDIKVMNMKLEYKDSTVNCYDDDFDIDEFGKKFYTDMLNDVVPVTSLINQYDFEEAFTKDIEAGNKIICFTMAKGISGTYQSAFVVANELNNKYGKTLVHVVDSMTAGFGEGLQAIRAYELAKGGMHFSALVKDVEEFKLKVRSEFTCDSIKYLRKTGRIGSAVTRFINMLSIKIMLRGGPESTIEMTGISKGRKSSIKKLADTCLKKIVDPDNQIVYISHSDCLDEANVLKDLLIEGGIKNIRMTMYDFISGTHVGPGAIAVFYIGENKD